MKYDLNKKMTLGAKRVLDAFSNALLHALVHERFENITVGELCEYAKYPRATFYNYFDDKYDLLSYCVSRVFREINIDDYDAIAEDQRLHVFFERFYDLAEAHRDIVEQIFQHDINNLLFSCITIQLNTVVQKFVADCERMNRSAIPNSMISQHYTNTIMLVVQSCIVQNHSSTKEQALYYLDYFLKGI